MAYQSQGYLRAFVATLPDAPDHVTDTKAQSWSFTSGAAQYQRVVVSGGAFTALTVPSGALAVAVLLPATGAHEITVKGATGDTGTVISGSYGMPYCSPLRQGAGVGFQNTGANATIDVFWF